MKKVFISFLILVLIPIISITCFAKDRVVDDAGLLTDSEVSSISSFMDKLSEQYGMDFVIVTTNDTGNKSTEAYADDYFDYNGYGMGVNHDGVLLLIDMDNRKIWISTSGYGTYAFSDFGIDKTLDEVYDELQYGRYYEACRAFGEFGSYIVKSAKEGTVYDIYYSNDEEPEFDWKAGGFIGAIIGLISAGISGSKMKNAMNSVSKQSGALNYIPQESFVLNEQKDIFLYRNVTRTAKPRETSSSSRGGSSTHTSSSGRSHGGGGRSF